MLTDIIAIDPGLANGCAHVRVTPDGFQIVSTTELPPIETGQWLHHAITSVVGIGSTEFVIERFTITAKTAQNSQAPWSLEVIGQTKWIVAERAPGHVINVQSVSDSKAAFTNDRLRKYGLWHVGGKGHAVEALRHVALFAHRQKILPQVG